MNEFCLMHKNNIVASVSIEKDAIGVGHLHIQSLNDASWLPFGVKKASPQNIDQQMTTWNNARCIPLGRPNYEQILENLHISANAELLPYSYMCSLTDCYWFKPSGSNTIWEDVNFRDNGFSSNLYKHLFYGDKGESINTFNSPDITTDGYLPKMWREENGKFVLIKGDQIGPPSDACCEFVASAIFDEIQADHVKYVLVDIDGRTYSKCECFIQSNSEEFVPIENIMKDIKCDDQSKLLQELSSMGFKDDVDKMILGDFIIGNIDRHPRNYGLIIDSNTQEIKRFAPLFDHGTSEIFNEHGFLEYFPTGKSFNKTLNDLESHVLSLVENINFGHIQNSIQSLPLDERTKARIIENVSARLDKIIEMSRGHDYDYDRGR